jgi:hypothetical protein
MLKEDQTPCQARQFWEDVKNNTTTREKNVRILLRTEKKFEMGTKCKKWKARRLEYGYPENIKKMEA